MMSIKRFRMEIGAREAMRGPRHFLPPMTLATMLRSWWQDVVNHGRGSKYLKLAPICYVSPVTMMPSTKTAQQQIYLRSNARTYTYHSLTVQSMHKKWLFHSTMLRAN